MSTMSSIVKLLPSRTITLSREAGSAEVGAARTRSADVTVKLPVVEVVALVAAGRVRSPFDVHATVGVRTRADAMVVHQNLRRATLRTMGTPAGRPNAHLRQFPEFSRTIACLLVWERHNNAVDSTTSLDSIRLKRGRNMPQSTRPRSRVRVSPRYADLR